MFWKNKLREDSWLIVGLGNPGPEYEDTRHNCGFIVLDILARELNIDLNKKKFKGWYGEGAIGGSKVFLLKPLTYMNNSGEAVRDMLDWYKLDVRKLIAVYDDVDLASGSIRVRPRGSAGSHNGMRSILQYTDTEDFARVRVGIGNRPQFMGLADYVLGHFTKDEKSILTPAFQRAAEAVKCIVREGADNAMNMYNGA